MLRGLRVSSCENSPQTLVNRLGDHLPSAGQEVDGLGASKNSLIR